MKKGIKKVTTMAELKEKALHIADGMEVYFQQWNKKTTLRVGGFCHKINERAYAYHNSIVAFVDENLECYVIPDLKGIQKILIQNGYLKGHFFVPLSYYDIPTDKELYSKWETLLREKYIERKNVSK